LKSAFLSLGFQCTNVVVVEGGRGADIKWTGLKQGLIVTSFTEAHIVAQYIITGY